MFDCFIIGKGPAGVSAGLYLARAGFSVALSGTEETSLGGAVIENYYGVGKISGHELYEKGIAQVKSFGAEVFSSEITGLSFDGTFTVKTKDATYGAKTVILALGAKRSKPEIKGITEFFGKGVSYCATCDGFLYRKKDVAVLGAGEYAKEEALALKTVGCNVTVFSNGEPEADFSGFRLEKGKVRCILGDSAVSGLETENGKFSLSAVFVAVGKAGAFEMASHIGLPVSNGFIVHNPDMSTVCPGLFVAGDITGGLMQVSTAVGEGAIAGTSAIKFLKSNG